MRKFPLNFNINETLPDLWDQVIGQEKEAFDFGFYWETLDQLVKQVQSEANEIKEAFDDKDGPHLQEEIGDLLHASIGLSIFCGFNPKKALEVSIQKFEARLKCLKEIAQKEGHETLEEQPLNVLMDYWNKSKKETENQQKIKS